MSDLPMPIQIQYGSFVFPTETETLSVRGTPHYDEAGRTITHIVYEIALRTWLESDPDGQTVGGLDQAGIIANARTQLLAIAQPFYYINGGLGGLRINVGGTQDVLWGPKPVNWSFTPLSAAGNACRIEWTVAVAIPEFGHDVPFGRPMEFNYELNISQNEAGISTRKYSGHIIIPQTRGNPQARDLSDCADRYLEQITPQLIPGFRRGPMERTIDKSKCRLNWTMTDTELPSEYAPPPGVINAEVSHELETNDANMLKWHGVFSAQYEVVKGTPRGVTLSYFRQFVLDRLNVAANGAEAQTVLPVKFKIREHNLYGPPTVSYSLAYTYVTKVKNLLQSTGMFRQVPGSNWQQWMQSLKTTAFSPRGTARLAVLASDDAIWDLGVGEAEKLPTPRANILPAPKAEALLQGIFQEPTAEESWVEYVNGIQLFQMDETCELKPLPTVSPTTNKKANLSVLGQPPGGQKTEYQQPGPVSIIQTRAKPTIIAVMSGYATRAGFNIPRPSLVTVGGANATPQNAAGYGFGSQIIGNWGGIPLVQARWRLRYVLDRVPPNAVLPPPNPMLATGTTDQNGQKLPIMTG